MQITQNLKAFLFLKENVVYVYIYFLFYDYPNLKTDNQ